MVHKSVGWQQSCEHPAPPVPQTVLDPFSGAGTTGLVAARFDRNYIGIELNPEYAEMSRKRIADRVGVTDPDELDPGEQAQGRMF
jgi:tRNA/tmRNA/rRNA uracil-C5-methylase (TrmA/RlmC/RlmD family)